MIKNDLKVDPEDEKFKRQMEKFMNLCCEETPISEHNLCSVCAQSREQWEKEYGTKFWNIFRWTGKKKKEAIRRYIEIFFSNINPDDFSEEELEDIEYLIKKGLEATFTHKFDIMFPRAIE